MENTLILENTSNHTGLPFSISFEHKHEKITITLKDNKDLFKLAVCYTELLDKLEVEYIVSKIIKTTKNED